MWLVRSLIAGLLLVLANAAHAQVGCVPNPNVTPLSNSPWGVKDGCPFAAAGINSLVFGQSMTPQSKGAKCDGVTDDTTALTAAFNSAVPVFIPAGTCKFASTIQITTNGVKVYGEAGGAFTNYSSRLLCATGTSDCFSFPGNPTDGFVMQDIYLDGTGQTGGAMINASNTRYAQFRNITINSPYNGVSILQNENADTFANVTINSPTGSYALKWYQPVVAVSDVLNLDHFIVNCNSSGADGVVWDGNAKTMNANNLEVINCAYPFHVQNTQSSGTSFPEYLQMVNSQFDQNTKPFTFDSGSFMQITNSEVDAKVAVGGTDAFQINYDSSITSGGEIWISNSKIFDAENRCLFINNQFVFLSNNEIRNCSGSGLANSPLVELGAHASVVILNGNYINDSQASYGIVTDSGAAGCYFSNNDLVGNHTGGISDGAGCFSSGGNQVRHINISTSSSTTVSPTFSPTFADTPAISCTQGGANSGGNFYISAQSASGFTITQTNSVTQAYQCIASGN